MSHISFSELVKKSLDAWALNTQPYGREWVGPSHTDTTSHLWRTVQARLQTGHEHFLPNPCPLAIHDDCRLSGYDGHNPNFLSSRVT